MRRKEDLSYAKVRYLDKINEMCNQFMTKEDIKKRNAKILKESFWEVTRMYAKAAISALGLACLTFTGAVHCNKTFMEKTIKDDDQVAEDIVNFEPYQVDGSYDVYKRFKIMYNTYGYINVYVDTSVNKKYGEHIDYAILYYNQIFSIINPNVHLNKIVKDVKVTDMAKNAIVITNDNLGYENALGKCTSLCLFDFYNRDQVLSSNIISIDKSTMDGNYATTVMVHELGHAFGLQHSDYVDSLMQPSVQNIGFAKYGTITPSDMGALIVQMGDTENYESQCKEFLDWYKKKYTNLVDKINEALEGTNVITNFGEQFHIKQSRDYLERLFANCGIFDVEDFWEERNIKYDTVREQ